MPRPLVPVAALCVALCLVFAAAASAADSVWWTDYKANVLARAPLSGGSGFDIVRDPGGAGSPYGSVVDAATGKVYWVKFDANAIGVANLDGSGATTLNTAGATVRRPAGLAIDTAGGRIYWSNQELAPISWAALDGSGGGDLDITGAPAQGPIGVAVDPAAGRIYWANFVGRSIGYAGLDGGGGGEVPIPAEYLVNPSGVAVDAASGTIYWANHFGNSIGFARLDGLGAGVIPTAAVAVGQPTGIAIDHEAGRLYWTNELGDAGVFTATLDGGDAHRLDTGTAAVAESSFPFLFKAPKRAEELAVPAILPGVKLGGQMICGTGRWEPDLPESFLFRAPQSFSYSWSLNSAPLPGATGQSLTATVPNGYYTCQVTATNGAGSTTAGGGAWGSAAEEPRPSRPLLQILKLRRSPKSGTATILLTVSGPGTAMLWGKRVVRRTVKSSGSGVVKLKLATKGKARKRLKRAGHLSVPVTIAFRADEGAKTFISRAITLSRRIRR